MARRKPSPPVAPNSEAAPAVPGDAPAPSPFVGPVARSTGGVDLAHALEAAQAALIKVTAEKDAAYSERNRGVAALARCVRALNYPAWLDLHPATDASWDPAWRNIVFILTPQGQCAWHIHESELPLFDFLRSGENCGPWDGHTTEQKYQRLEAWRPALRRS